MQIILYHTHWTSPDASTELPAEPDAAARGRNGWFCPRQFIIWRGAQVRLVVLSSRQGENAPIELQISPAAAHALGSALLLAAAEQAAVPTAAADPAVVVSVEVEWHPDYRGGDYDDTGELTVVDVPVGPDAYVTDALVDAAFRQSTGQDPVHIIRWVEVEEPVGGFRVCSVCGADIPFDPLDMPGCAHCQAPICPACARRGHVLCQACAGQAAPDAAQSASMDGATGTL